MTYTINTNTTFNSLEITFDSKPDQKIRAALKSLKFRWHNTKKLWYGYAEEKALTKALGFETPETTPENPKPKKSETKSTHSKRIKYYKAVIQDSKKRFVESWGEPLTIKLPNGTALKCACEFIRGEGWKITDTASGILAQGEKIPNKKALEEYRKDSNYLQALARATNTESYKKSAKELTEYQKQFI